MWLKKMRNPLLVFTEKFAEMTLVTQYSLLEKLIMNLLSCLLRTLYVTNGIFGKYFVSACFNFMFWIFIRRFGFPCGSAGKESACNAGDLGLIPGLGRFPGEGKGYPFQSSGLENSTNSIVHGVTKSWTRLSDFHFNFLVSVKLSSRSLHTFTFCLPLGY